MRPPTESTGEPFVYSITLNWNTPKHTVDCITSLKKMSFSNIKSVVVDNGSTDGSVDYLRKEFGDSIEILETQRNLGYSGGFNKGIEYVMKKNPDFILIHNNDIIFGKNALKELTKMSEIYSNVGFVTGKVYYYNRPRVLQSAGRESHPTKLVGEYFGANEVDVGQCNETRECDYCDDVFLLVNSSVINDVGSYDPDFFLMYEITDWCFRTRKKGYKIIYTPKARIWHKVSQSTGGPGNPGHRYYLARNEILFMRKNAPEAVFNKFLFEKLTVGLFKRTIAYTIKLRFDIVSSIIKGNISGLIWLLSYNKQHS